MANRCRHMQWCVLPMVALTQKLQKRGTQQTTQKPTSAPPRTCRTAPIVLLRVEDMPRTSLPAGRTRATLVREAAPSPRAKATIGWRGPLTLTHAWEPLDLLVARSSVCSCVFLCVNFGAYLNLQVRVDQASERSERPQIALQLYIYRSYSRSTVIY
eukprot:COSAG05_NODE_2768_length_2665_cov_2.257989_2_plen_157_part_00